MGSVGGKSAHASSVQQSGGANASAQQATSGQSIWGPQQGALTDLYGQAQQLMTGGGQYGQAGQDVGNMGTAAWGSQLQPGSNPYFDASVQASIDQASDSFKRQILPGLDDRSAGVGQLGSSRDRLATGEAAGIFGQGMAQSVAQQRANQYAGDQGRALQAVGMTPQMMQSQYQPLLTAAGLIGGPTALSSAQSSGWGSGQQWSGAQSNSSDKAANLSVLSKNSGASG